MRMKTQKVYRAKAVIEEKFQVRIQARDHEMIVDEPKPMGDNAGMTPMEMLLGAISGCKSLVFKVAAKNFKVTYTALAIEVEGDFDSAGYLGDPTVPIGFSAIRTIYQIDTTAAKEDVEKLIAYVETHCPVAATIEVAPEISTILKYNDPQ